MFKKIAVAERLPEMMKFVTTIDEANEQRVYRMTEEGWNMRDVDGTNSPNNNLVITHWLEEIQDFEELGNAIDRIDNLYHALTIPMPAQFHIDQLKTILPEAITELKDGYKKVTGENPWEFRDNENFSE